MSGKSSKTLSNLNPALAPRHPARSAELSAAIAVSLLTSILRPSLVVHSLVATLFSLIAFLLLGRQGVEG